MGSPPRVIALPMNGAGCRGVGCPSVGAAAVAGGAAASGGVAARFHRVRPFVESQQRDA